MPVINQLPRLIGKKQVEDNRMLDVATLSQETGISRQTLYKWLDRDLDQFRAATIEALCRYFNCGIEDLLRIEDAERGAKSINRGH